MNESIHLGRSTALVPVLPLLLHVTTERYCLLVLQFRQQREDGNLHLFII